MAERSGGFTLPGEAGYEELTLELARRWGADAIRDSDGTRMSDRLIEAGYPIYSTVCLVRDHNDWIRQHPECRQQAFLISQPAMADSAVLAIDLLQGYFRDQFAVNETSASQARWQVFDRTADREIPFGQWSYADGQVHIRGCTPFHQYTVNFLVYRIWEEISMYNHVTNHWTSEHQMQLDPRWPVARAYLLGWLDNWCRQHSATGIVRLTSLFYNFTWIWGADERRKNLFTDWGSYNFSVSDRALADFAAERGYELTSEDFVNQGKYHSTHRPPDSKMRDWMDFTQQFVAGLARELVEVIHRHGKKAYVFYDDSWIGLEPYGPYFASIGLDGLIKCVFSGFEARLCAGCQTVPVHELRLHPYLFPVGLGGLPTFAPGGDPGRDARRYWSNIRRALMRQPVDRLGLGGYLHLVEDHPGFVQAIDDILDEFHLIRQNHALGQPASEAVTVGILHAWGRMRSWTLSGHMHESDQHPLIHIIESLSGLPFKVRFLDFADITGNGLADVDVLINAGSAGDAWSGGDGWTPDAVAAISAWVSGGGVLVGVGEPGALPGRLHTLQVGPVLGVDLDRGEFASHGRWTWTAEALPSVTPEGLTAKQDIFLLNPDVRVLAADGQRPALTEHGFGRGKGVYLADFTTSPVNSRRLFNLIFHALGRSPQVPVADDEMVDLVYFPDRQVVLAANASGAARQATIRHGERSVAVELPPWAMQQINL